MNAIKLNIPDAYFIRTHNGNNTKIGQGFVVDIQLLKNDPEEAIYDETCFEIKQSIDPSYIVNHYHPNKIEDPNNHQRIYTSEITSCELCENKI